MKIALQDIKRKAMREYTNDRFECGLCGHLTPDIDSYVTHMVLKEQCVLHLCPSTAIMDLLLPRFCRKKHREDEEEDVDIKHHKDLAALIDKETLEVKDIDKEVLMHVAEVETGSQQRWKCKLCSLTFSRQAAVFNHFKIQHSIPGMNNENSSTEVKKESSLEVKELNEPVKHIVAVESKSPLEQMTNIVSGSEKLWDKFVCQKCGQKFKSGKILRTHMAVVHSDMRPFQCSFEGCSHSFKTKGSLKRHQRRHTGERPFRCEDCGRCFRESGSLIRHQQARVSCVSKSDFQLPLYGITKPIDSDHVEKKPLAHQIKLWTDLKEEMQCSLSADVGNEEDEETKVTVKSELTAFKGLQSIKQEESIVHRPLYNESIENTDPFLLCKAEPHPVSSPVISPAEEENSEASPSLERNQADDSRETLLDIKPPQLTLDILRRSFTCPLCSQNYSRKANLMSHMQTHLGEISGKCIKCGKSFSNHQALCRHLVAHSSIRQFVCQLCNKDFKLLSHAKAHLRSHTDAKTVPCRHCNHLFKSKSARNLHERIHTKSRAFICIRCSRAFVTKASLIRHFRTHTGESPFQCKYCGRRFKEHGTLSRHLKNKMPCAKQAVVQKQSGDVGIHLVPESKKNAKITSTKESDDEQEEEEEEEEDRHPRQILSTCLKTSAESNIYSIMEIANEEESELQSAADMELLLMREEDLQPADDHCISQQRDVQEVLSDCEASSYILISDQSFGTTDDLLAVMPADSQSTMEG